MSRMITKSIITNLLMATILGGISPAFAVSRGSDLSKSYESAIIYSNETFVSTKRMEQQKTDVKAGRWGGTGLLLSVEKRSATIEFECANATIASRLSTGKGGKFSATGTLTRRSFGPIRLDSMPQPQPARFEGKVTGIQMKLKVTLIETGELIGNYVLEHNKLGRMTRCY